MAFASKPEGSGDRTEGDQTLMPSKPGCQAAQDSAARRSDRVCGLSRCFRDGVENRRHLRPSHRPLRPGMIRRTRRRFDEFSCRLDPFLGSEIELILQLVPQPILTADFRQNELSILCLRRRLFITEQGKDRIEVEPFGRAFQSCRRAVTRPPV